MVTVQESVFKDDPKYYCCHNSVTPSIDYVPVLKNYADKMVFLERNKWHCVLQGTRTEFTIWKKSQYFVRERFKGFRRI